MLRSLRSLQNLADLTPRDFFAVNEFASSYVRKDYEVMCYKAGIKKIHYFIDRNVRGTYLLLKAPCRNTVAREQPRTLAYAGTCYIFLCLIARAFASEDGHRIAEACVSGKDGKKKERKREERGTAVFIPTSGLCYGNGKKGRREESPSCACARENAEA